MAVQRLLLSRSAAGKCIVVTGTTPATATPIHQAVAGDSAIDEVYVKVTNNHTEPVWVTVLWGDDDPEDMFTMEIPPRDGRVDLINGDCLNNSHTISIYASVANVISVTGYVNRISND